MRFDGKLGFPGGLVEPGEDITTGLNRELSEEINLDVTKHAVEEEDFLFCHYLPHENDTMKSSRIRFFFAKQVTKPEYKVIEKRSLVAKEFGYEVRRKLSNTILYKIFVRNECKFPNSSLTMLKFLFITELGPVSNSSLRVQGNRWVSKIS